jgi:hypothetical protein
MASRIFWVLISGLALVTGMVLQDGGRIFSWADDRTDISARTERAIEAGVERAVEGSLDSMQVVGSDGRRIDVAPETKRALADAVGRLVKAEAELAVLGIRDASDQEIQAASVVRDKARVEVETLKAQIEQQEQLSGGDRDVVREQIRTRIRDDIRETVRDAVRN